MDKIKNYAIAILTGLLALSLFTQPAQSAGKSKEAKDVEYHVCVDHKMKNYDTFDLMFNTILKECAKYRP